MQRLNQPSPGTDASLPLAGGQEKCISQVRKIVSPGQSYEGAGGRRGCTISNGPIQSSLTLDLY